MANLIFAAAILILIYRRFVAATDVLTATTICLGIVLVFAFGEYAQIGNYNYAAPYSHEVPHGLLLSILTVARAPDWLDEGKNSVRFRRRIFAVAALVFLTKPDVLGGASRRRFALAFVIFGVNGRRIAVFAKSLAAILSAAMVPRAILSFIF